MEPFEAYHISFLVQLVKSNENRFFVILLALSFSAPHQN